MHAQFQLHNIQQEALLSKVEANYHTRQVGLLLQEAEDTARDTKEQIAWGQDICDMMRSSSRRPIAPDYQGPNVGFRIVVSSID